MLKLHVEGTPAFTDALALIVARGEADFSRVEDAVRAILAAVRAEGDDAVNRYAERFDRRRAPRLLVRDYPGAAALARLPDDARAALMLAATRIRAFHEHQRDNGFRYTEEGITLGV